MKKWMIGLLLLAISGGAQAVYVSIGGTNVAADSLTGYGRVDYDYQISVYEVTGAEFGAAVAADSNVGLSNPNSGSNPAASVSWYEALKYCNWLTSGDAYLGAYTHSGGSLTGIDRESAISTYGTVYVLPTKDEWYKAAYWRDDAADQWSLYANGTDTAPTIAEARFDTTSSWAVGTGAVEQNGTYDMMGNCEEWTETTLDGQYRYMSGGHYLLNASRASAEVDSARRPTQQSDYIGFRVAVVPEPATAGMFALSGLLIAGYRRIRNAYGA